MDRLLGDVYIIMKNYIYERKKGKYIHLNPSLIPKYSIHPPERKEKRESWRRKGERKKRKERKKVKMGIQNKKNAIQNRLNNLLPNEHLNVSKRKYTP